MLTIANQVESSLLTHAAVENILVVGESSRTSVVCLLIPSQQGLDSIAAKVTNCSVISQV